MFSCNSYICFLEATISMHFMNCLKTKLVIVSIQLKDHKSYLSYMLAKGNDEYFSRGRGTCSHLLYSIYC